MSNPLIRYKFDSSGVALNSVNTGLNALNNSDNISTIVDPTYGPVAQFDGQQSFYLDPTPTYLNGNNTRSLSFWFKTDALLSSSALFSIDRGTANEYSLVISVFGATNRMTLDFGTSTALAQFDIPNGVWFHVAVTYAPNTHRVYVDGVQKTFQSSSVAINTSSTKLQIGAHSTGFNQLWGVMSDFRLYNTELSASAVSTLYSDGPNPDRVKLIVTIYTHVADLVWEAVSGATSYNVTVSKDSGTEEHLITTSGLTHEVYNLIPGSSYEFKVYSDLDTVNPEYTVQETALLVNSTNVDSLVERLSNDLTFINDVALDEINPFLNTALETGDVVKTSVGDVTFVSNSDSLTLSSQNERVLTPFDGTSGSGQSITIVLPDTSTETFTYDETTNEVISSSVNYAVDSYFVFGNQKVTVKEI